MREYILKKSSKPDKKWMVKNDNKTIHFGASGMSDFTKHKDEERKNRYIARHKVNQDWNNPKTAGFWAKNILWNKPTLEQSIKDTERRFNIKIIYGGKNPR